MQAELQAKLLLRSLAHNYMSDYGLLAQTSSMGIIRSKVEREQ